MRFYCEGQESQEADTLAYNLLMAQAVILLNILEYIISAFFHQGEMSKTRLKGL